MSRHRILNALTAAVVLTAMTVALAACGGGSESEKSGEKAGAVLDEATLEGIDSADLELTADVKVEGSQGGELDISLSGPFKSEGKGELPQVDMTAEAKGTLDGEDIDFEGGVVLLPNSAYVNYEGIEYEVDPATFGFLESTLQESQGKEGPTACQEEFGKIDVGSFVKDGVNEGSAEVDGTATTKISGELNVFVAPDAVLKAIESPACRAQLAAAGELPSKSEIEESKEEVEEALTESHVDLYVGDDNIIRQISAQMQFAARGRRDGPSKIELDFELKLAGINEEQEISAPEDAKPLSRLFAKLGINPLDLLGVLQGEGEGLDELLEQLDLPSSTAG